MNSKSFKAMVVQETAAGTYTRRIAEKSLDDLPAGEVLVRVHYSSLNYKDGLSATGHRGVTKHYPHTPGVDAAGVVEESHSEAFQPGDQVIVTSYDLGMNTPGGFGQYIRVPAGWVVPLPENLSLKESMAYGSAGLTAGFCIFKLQEHGITPDQGEILVTGATGGVGSFAVAMLARIGYQVIAVTGKMDEGFRTVFKGVLKDLSLTESEVDRYIDQNKEELTQQRSAFLGLNEIRFEEKPWEDEQPLPWANAARPATPANNQNQSARLSSSPLHDDPTDASAIGIAQVIRNSRDSIFDKRCWRHDPLPLEC